MVHRNRWFTELKNGWIFPWQTVSHNQMVTISVGFLTNFHLWGITFQPPLPGPTGTGRGDAHSGDPTGTMAVAQVKVLFNEPGY
jgi:hypothetical protein